MKYTWISFILALMTISCASPKKTGISPEKRKAQIYYNQGTRELLNKNYTVALKHLLEAYTLDKEDSKILNNLGMAYFFKKRPDTAIKTVLKAIKLDPKNIEARVNLGTIYTNTGRYEQAKRQYLLVLDNLTYSRQYKTYFNLGVLHLKLNKELEAINYFHQAINENSNYCPAFLKLGDINFRKKDYVKSLGYYKKAGTGVCYDNPDPLYRQALSLLKLKEYGSAKLKLEEVIERFSLTKFERMAHKKIKDINQKIYSPEQETNAPKRNILSPNF